MDSGGHGLEIYGFGAFGTGMDRDAGTDGRDGGRRVARRSLRQVVDRAAGGAGDDPA